MTRVLSSSPHSRDANARRWLEPSLAAGPARPAMKPPQDLPPAANEAACWTSRRRDRRGEPARVCAVGAAPCGSAFALVTNGPLREGARRLRRRPLAPASTTSQARHSGQHRWASHGDERRAVPWRDCLARRAITTEGKQGGRSVRHVRKLGLCLVAACAVAALGATSARSHQKPDAKHRHLQKLPGPLRTTMALETPPACSPPRKSAKKGRRLGGKFTRRSDYNADRKANHAAIRRQRTRSRRCRIRSRRRSHSTHRWCGNYRSNAREGAG